jgi:hypothetical protein
LLLERKTPEKDAAQSAASFSGVLVLS